MERNNNNLPVEDEQRPANGHALKNGNGVVHPKEEAIAPAANGWGQVLWNTWDAFADVAWFIICCIGYILQVCFFKNDIGVLIYWLLLE